MSKNEIFSMLPKISLYKDLSENIIISYRKHEVRNKPYLVFLHGYNGNSKSWAYQFKYFRKDFSIIAIDFPGFGQSQTLIDPDMYKVSGLIKRILIENNVKNFSLVGHSMGGMLAQVLCGNNPDLVNKLILSCTHTGYALNYKSPLREAYLNRLEQRRKLSDTEYGKLRIKSMLPNLSNKDIFNFLAKISEEITDEGILCGGASMQILNTQSLLKKIKCPCLIITGSDDVVVSKEKSNFLKQNIKNNINHEITGVGHAPYCEDHQKFNNLIYKFIDS